MLQAELRILGGKHQGKLISLNTKKFLVGREQDCHLRPNSDLVSRHHCVFSIDEYAVRLRDLGSTNGTLVNGEPLRGEIPLKSGDRITIGKLELEVVIRQFSSKGGLSSKTPPPVPKSTPTLTPAEMTTKLEDTDTSYDLSVLQSLPDATPSEMDTTELPLDATATIPADTAIIDAVANQFAPQPMQQFPPPAPGYPQMMPPQYPMGGYMPPQYPQYAPPYGQPAYGAPPGYGQPMGYPMGYPQMMPMQPSYPGVAVAAPPTVAEPETVEEVTTASSDEMAVKLPNPEDTGFKAAPPPAAPAAGAAAPKKEEKPSTSAADIIKQYMNKRS